MALEKVQQDLRTLLMTYPPRRLVLNCHLGRSFQCHLQAWTCKGPLLPLQCLHIGQCSSLERHEQLCRSIKDRDTIFGMANLSRHGFYYQNSGQQGLKTLDLLRPAYAVWSSATMRNHKAELPANAFLTGRKGA